MISFQILFGRKNIQNLLKYSHPNIDNGGRKLCYYPFKVDALKRNITQQIQSSSGQNINIDNTNAKLNTLSINRQGIQ